LSLLKKRISEFIFFSLFCFLLIFCIRLLFIFLKDKFNYENNQLYYLLTSFLLVFWLAGISYGKLWSMRASRKQIIAVSIGWLLLWLCLFTFLPAVKEARRFHEQVFADHIRAMHGRAYMKDDTLGLKAIPGAECKEMYTVGEPLQINYDERGYRIPAEGDSLCDPGTAPQLLFLGCSFTFGAGVPAEETYPYKVAHQTNIPYLNTGLGSYGLAHITNRAMSLSSTAPGWCKGPPQSTAQASLDAFHFHTFINRTTPLSWPHLFTTRDYSQSTRWKYENGIRIAPWLFTFLKACLFLSTITGKT
jgi:hypothetical protein